MWFWAAGPTEDANEFRKLSPFPCLTCNSSSPAPNQHHSSGSCPGELGNSGPHPLSLVLSHIHSKTACRGASACQWHASYEPTGAERRPSPSAPAKNGEVSRVLTSPFFVSVPNILATRCGCALRSACRASPPKRRLWRMQRGGDGAAVGDWQGGPAAADRAGHRKRACEASSSPSLHFPHVMEESPSLPLLYSSLSHPASSASNRCYPLQHPKRTRFRLFRPKPGAFRCFSGSNFLGRNLCFLPSVVGGQPVL